MEKPINPIRETDDEARGLARELIDGARIAALGVVHPDTGAPHVTRIAITSVEGAGLVSLISDLSLHTRALKTAPRCSLLLGEPGEKGDPLNSPRITLDCDARFVTRDEAEIFAILQRRYLAAVPKAKVYADFLDFSFVRFDVLSGALNGGFGKAFELSRDDLFL